MTGIGMTKGLTLARAFHQCGHHVIGADFETSRLQSPGRVSNACAKFYRLDIPVNGQRYTEQLLQVVKKEHVHLWVSCSGVATALDDGRAQEAIRNLTDCCCIQFNAEITALLHDKATFLHYTQELGLPVPRTYNLTSTAAACKVLEDLEERSKQKKQVAAQRFILKPVGVDDANRGNMTLLPLSTPIETVAYVKRFPITKDNAWILQQYIPGEQEYCTHALIVSGEVKVFVACPSSELLMHYKALAPSDPLCCKMLDFTRKFAARCKEEFGSFTGHLSFDFMVEDHWTGNWFEKKLYAIECNPRAHTAVVLFAQEGPEMQDMVQAYLSVLGNSISAGSWPGESSMRKSKITEACLEDVIVPPLDTRPRYWIGHDMTVFLLLPFLEFLRFRLSLDELLKSVRTFAKHLYCWNEGAFTAWDPWPFVKLYHDYWPRAILFAAWEKRRWSRVNVSTTKMFAI